MVQTGLDAPGLCPEGQYGVYFGSKVKVFCQYGLFFWLFFVCYLFDIRHRNLHLYVTVSFE